MHIPDSVLSPASSLVANAVMLPIWTIAGRQVKAKLATRETPLLALGSAFSFTIMLFNIPAPGGTTAHAIGATLLAILLGPWSALIGVSVALAIQALFFGDGGLWAFGANCFTMAFVQPFAGYAVYRLCLRLLQNSERRNLYASAIGAYIGINAGAVAVAVLLGIQPALAHTPEGRPLYFPFGLNVALPAMLSVHLLVAGVAEAIITAFVVQSAQALNLPLYNATPPTSQPRPAAHHPLWLVLCTLIALSPLGLIAQGSAWGEWDKEELKQEISRRTGRTELPTSLEAADSRSYKGIAALQKYGGGRGAWAYIASGFLGACAIAGLFRAGGRAFATPEPLPPAPPPAPRRSQEIPAWLLSPASAERAAPPPAKMHASRYLERTLGEIAAAIGDIATKQAWSERDGLLQSLDARAKLLGIVALALTASLVRDVVAPVLLCLFGLFLACASKIPVSALMKRTLGLTALFGGATALPSFAIACYARDASGALLAVALLLKLIAAAMFASLLAMTTRWNDLLGGLRKLGVPRMATALIAMSHRYLHLSLQTANEMFLARKSRMVGAETADSSRRFIGFSVAAFFGKTLHLAEEIHQALLARGFQGDFAPSPRLRWRMRDSLWILSVAMIGIYAWMR